MQLGSPTPLHTRGAKKLQPAQKVGPDYVGKTPDDLAKIEADIGHRVSALAKQLNYTGTLTADAFEDNIYSGMRRSVEGTLMVGMNLLLLKEATAYGYFLERIAGFGITQSMASRFMSAALKFANHAAPHTLAAAGNQTKLMELLVLDDDSIEALESGASVNGLTLDTVDRMSSRELRVALRGAKADADIVRQNIAKADAKVREAEFARNKAQRLWLDASPDEQRAKLVSELDRGIRMVRAALGLDDSDRDVGVRGAMLRLQQYGVDQGVDMKSLLADKIVELLWSVRAVRDDDELALPMRQDLGDEGWLHDAK